METAGFAYRPCAPWLVYPRLLISLGTIAPLKSKLVFLLPARCLPSFLVHQVRLSKSELTRLSYIWWYELLTGASSWLIPRTVLLGWPPRHGSSPIVLRLSYTRTGGIRPVPCAILLLREVGGDDELLPAVATEIPLASACIMLLLTNTLGIDDVNSFC
jgi:hypothetical protein